MSDGSPGRTLTGRALAGRPAVAWWAVLAVGLLALNLRPGATSLGPVLAEVSADLRLGGTLAGVLTALPGLAFAIFGVGAVWISLRLGLAGTLALGAVAASAGLLARSVAGSAAVFLILSVLAFAGMAIGNVLVPAYIKTTFPRRIASMMSLYTVALALGATVGSLLSAPMAQQTPGGWRAALGAWGIAAGLATIPWVILGVRERRRRPPDAISRRASGSVFGMMRSRKAVALALFFGMQSLQAYVQFGWIAQMFRDGGVAPAPAGATASLIAGFGIPAGFVMPAVAARMRDPRGVVVVLGVLLVAGYVGVWLAPASLPMLWASLLGLSGFAFPFAMALLSARTRDPRVTARASGFTQSVGYLFSATGPLLVGVLWELSGGWTIPVWFLLGTAVVFVAAGLVAAAPGYIDDELGHG